MIRNIPLLLLFFLLLCSGMTGAQTTEGTDFWLTFMNNENTPEGSAELTLKLIVSARQDATVSVSNPQTGWNTSFSVKAGSVAELEAPHTQAYTYEAASVHKRGLHVTATAPVSLYASNFREHTYDATIVLPVNGLGIDYIVQMFENTLYARELAVVATGDNTTVTITPHARTTDGHVKNVPFSVTLNEGETYQLLSSDTGSDFTGTRVQADKPVAVFSGHQCINVPTGNPCCDHIVEQQMPVQMWGRQFAITQSSGQKGDRVMLTARDNDTEVFLNGTKQTTLAALQSYEFRLTGKSAFVETSAPAACYLYLEGARDNNMQGDPSSVHISPVEQRVMQMTFATFQTSVSRTHYVNVVTTAAGAAAMLLDGVSVASSFSPLTGNSSLRFAQINIPHGTHTLQTTADGFIGHVYGVGWCESYAYTIGSATLPLDGQILVDGKPRADIEYSDTRCYKTPVRFAPHANTEFHTIEWDFGDGSKSTEVSPLHTYAAPGDYRVEVRLINDDGKDTARTTLTLVETLYDTLYATICDGEKYEIHEYTFTTQGKHQARLISEGGCDSLVTLYLTVADTYFTEEEAEFRRGSSYRWHGRWLREENIYHDILPTIHGCDSVFQLTLTAVDATEEMFDTICYQNEYTFRDHTFTLPPIDGITVPESEYIDYILECRDKIECVTYRMNLAIAPFEDGSVEQHVTIQEGQTYNFYGEKLFREGDYHTTVSRGYGCEQEINLHLDVVSFPITETRAELCTEHSYTFRGKTYTERGTYADTVFTDTGIEAVYRLTLTDNRKHTVLHVSNVPSYFFRSTTLTASGIYRDTLPAANGCDSLVTLHLGIGEKCTVTTEVNRSICENKDMKWNEQTCTPGNTYHASFTTADGCDSLVTLTINPLPVHTTKLDVHICEGDYYRVGEQRIYDEGPHTVCLTSADGCDSIVQVNITYNQPFLDEQIQTINIGETYPWEGELLSKKDTYYRGFVAQSNGCDSIRILHLNVVIPDVPLYNNKDRSTYLQMQETYKDIPVNIILKWDFSANRWTTVALPFSLNSLEDTPFDGYVYEMTDVMADNAGGIILTFFPIDKIDAGKPYLICPQELLAEPRFERVLLETFEPSAVNVGEGDVEFRSIMTPAILTDRTSLFLNNNRLWYANQISGTRMRAFRAYFELMHPEQIAYHPRRIILKDITNDEEIIQGGEDGDDADSLNAPAVRKYLENGILIIERGGRRYTVIGSAID